MKAFNPRVLFVLLLAGFSALAAYAADVGAAKAGMRERVAVIDQLKAGGAVGEANTGYLAVRAEAAKAAEVVAAENADRAVVFEELAKKSGGSADAAAKAFARQMAAASKAGVWVQREDGGWFKK